MQKPSHGVNMNNLLDKKVSELTVKELKQIIAETIKENMISKPIIQWPTGSYIDTKINPNDIIC